MSQEKIQLTDEQRKAAQKLASQKYQNKLKVNYECRAQGIPEKYIIRKHTKKNMPSIIETVESSTQTTGSL